MAEYVSFISSLRKTLPESSWPWVVSALRHDPIIWQALKDNAFSARLLSKVKSAEDLRPAAIAHFLIKVSTSDLNQPQATDLQKAVAHVYDDIIGHSSANLRYPPHVAASLLAVGILGQIKKQGLSEVCRNLLLQMQKRDTDQRDLIRTALVILYGLSPNGMEILRALLSEDTVIIGLPLVAHILLSDPTPPTAKEKVIWSLLGQLPVTTVAALLRRFEIHHPDLARKMAAGYLDKYCVWSTDTAKSLERDIVTYFIYQLSLGDILSIAERHEQAKFHYSNSTKSLQALHERTIHQYSYQAQACGNPDEAIDIWQAYKTITQSSPPLPIVQSLTDRNGYDEPDTQTTAGNEIWSASQLVGKALTAWKRGDAFIARKHATDAINTLANQIQSQSLTEIEIRELIDALPTIISYFFDLSRPVEAMRAAQCLIHLAPTHAEGLFQLARAARLAGYLEKAIESAQTAVALAPSNTIYRRELALCLETFGEWQAALSERIAVTDPRFAETKDSEWPHQSDLCALASCALKAGDLERAEATCHDVIMMADENGLAHAIMGEILFAKGDHDGSIHHLQLATQQAPNLPEPWLALSRVYWRTGQIENSLQALSAASQVVSHHPEIHLSLGEIYLQKGSLTEAEEALGRAFQLLFYSGSQFRMSGYGTGLTSDRNKGNLDFTIRGKCAHLYALTLYKLGLIEKAGKVFEQGYSAHPAYPGLAPAYGRYLIEVDNLSAALEPFAVAVSVAPGDVESLIDYAQLLLDLKTNIETAVHSLETAQSLLANNQNSPAREVVVENLLLLRDSFPNHLPEILRDIPWHKSIVYQNGVPTHNYLLSLVLALLAQAYEANNQLDQALKTYSDALETSLGKEEHWRIILAIGMGRTALKNNQPEITIASLQDLGRSAEENPTFYRILSEAYTALGFSEEGIEHAKRAINLAPDDVDLLSWYAEQTFAFGRSQEAATVLKRAIELDPSRIDLALFLGKTLIGLGETTDASVILHTIATNQDADSKILYQTAAALSTLGENQAAAICLENALAKEMHPDTNMLLDLTSVYMKSGNDELALKTIDRALEHEPENPALHVRKAEVLQEMERDQAALAILEHARLLNPEDPDVHARIAAILYKQGHLKEAYLSAEASVEHLSDKANWQKTIQIRTLAATIARSHLDVKMAAEILSGVDLKHPEIESLVVDVPRSILADFYGLHAEINLELGEEVPAAQALNEIIKITPDNPRILALKARVAERSNDPKQARQDLDLAVNKLKESDSDYRNWSNNPCNVPLGIALAALDLEAWDTAHELIILAESKAPSDPYISLQKAKALVLRAEYERLCNMMDIIAHKPAGEAISESAYHEFSTILNSVKEFFAKGNSLSIPELLKAWESRGRVAFYPGSESINAFRSLATFPEEFTALLTALGQINDIDSLHLAYMDHSHQSGSNSINARVLAHYAIAISLSNPSQKDLERALEAIQKAIGQKSDCPYYHVALARLDALRGEKREALQAMETALSLWPDEPRWHAFAAELAISLEELTLAISHYEKALSLEPKYLNHYLNLGDACLRAGQYSEAIAVLQRAIEVAPEQIESYLALASIHVSLGNFSQAAAAAERAIAVAPDHIAPLLMRGEIALQMNNPRQAESCAEAALQLNPADSAANHLLARALDKQGRTSESLEILEKALRNASEPLPLLLERVNLLSRTQDKEATLSALSDLATKYPDEPRVLAQLAFSLAENNNREEAIRIAQRALRSVHDTLPPQMRSDLHFLVGRLLRGTGQLDQAIYHITEAIRFSPTELEKYLELGKIQQECRQHLQALETYKKAILIAPEDPQPYHQAGLTLKECRDYQGAENMLRRAAELAPHDRIIHRQLAALIALNLVHSRQPAIKES